MIQLLTLACVVLSSFASGMSMLLLYHTVTDSKRYKIPRHIIPLSISYTTITAVESARVYLGYVNDPWLIAVLTAALVCGIYGLMVALRVTEKTIGKP